MTIRVLTNKIMVTVFYLNYDILSYFYFLVVLHAIERPDLLYSLFAYFNFINSLYCNCYKNQEDSVADLVQIVFHRKLGWNTKGLETDIENWTDIQRNVWD